jgi:acyl dehydratase
MTISTSLCGLSLGQRTTTLQTRAMLAYAAGIGDVSPKVFDDLDADFMASPAYCVALEWPLISDPAVLAQLVADPGERQRAVHLIQDSHFHRPMRVGDRLSTSAVVTGIWGGAAGVRVLSTLRTVDAMGLDVVTSHTTAVYRGVETEGNDRPGAGVPDVPKPEGVEGSVQTAALAIDAALPHRYTECSGIWNPIHTERRAAKAAGLPDVVLHGTATWALAGSELVKRLADGNPARLKRLHGRFGALVFPGSVLELRFRIRPGDDMTEVFFDVFTSDGQKAVANGFALIAP